MTPIIRINPIASQQRLDVATDFRELIMQLLIMQIDALGVCFDRRLTADRQQRHPANPAQRDCQQNRPASPADMLYLVSGHRR